MSTLPQPPEQDKTQPDGLYLGDNGRCLCSEHLGAMASITGHDLSGQPIMRLTVPKLKAVAVDLGVFACETCGRGVQ